MTAPNHNWRKFKNILMQVIAFACAILVVTPLVLVFYHLVTQGFSSLNLAFFTQLPKALGEKGGGMANAIVGTFVLLAEAAVVGVPVGVLGGVFLSEYGGTKLNWWIRFAADILNGVPSITWGVVVYALMVVPMHGASALAGGVVLGSDDDSARDADDRGGAATGAGRLPRSRARAGHRQMADHRANRHPHGAQRHCHRRAAGAGARRRRNRAAAVHHRQSRLGAQLTEPIAAIPLQIYNYAISPYDDWHRQAWAGAFVLLLLVLAINVGVRFFTRDRFQSKA